MITELIGNKEIKKNYIFNPSCFGSSHVEVLFERKKKKKLKEIYY